MVTSDLIENVLREISPDDRFYLVDFRVSSSKIKKKVTVLVDTDEGIGIDECTQISRALGEALDEQIEDTYTLEVSSPGLDQPLKLPRQFKKNVGRELSLLCADGTELKGELLAIEGESISIQPKKKKKEKTNPETVTLALDEIKQAKVQVSFK
ncbi:ribosome maturation factor RimP [Marinilongibacter aquaticus]|uniref:ribosome maturation factor RimP n=1 Tax=Marinilongibacter aquaticus TaxID=2975157 RepID=UPI0021BDEA24|nr:ribosome maturation factor RimP [Marinilongibacter aquaticus]UBM60142.1 ribosome maturation factor RimP [Marinilongibacter aquaticus]